MSAHVQHGSSNGALTPHDLVAHSASAPSHDEATGAVFHRVHRLLRGRYIIAIVLAVLGAGAGAAVGWLSSRPMYRSEGMIRVRTVMPVVLKPTEDTQLAGNVYTYVNSQAILLQSQDVIRAAMQSDQWKALGRGFTPRSIEEFDKALDVKTSREDAEWIRVQFTDEDPKAAKIAVEQVIRAYEERNSETESFATPKKIALLDAKRQKSAQKIADLRERVRETAQEFGVSDLAQFHEQSVKRQLDLEKKIGDLKLALSQAEARAKTDQPGTSPSGDAALAQLAETDTILHGLLDERFRATTKLNRLRLAGFQPRHKDVINAQAAVDALNGQIEERTAQLVAGGQGGQEGLAIGTAAIAERVRAQLENFQREYDAVRKRTIELNDKRMLIESLNEQIERERTELNAVEQRIESLRTESSATSVAGVTDRITILDYGKEPFSPTWDNRAKYSVFGFLLGGGLPFGVVMLIGLLDHRVRYSDDARDGPVHPTLLGILPTLPSQMNDPEQAAIAAHCVHQIRALLQIGSAVDGRRVFAITSPTAGDGKTSLSLSLGLSFAASGARTLLIDFDFIGAGLTSALEARADLGTLDVVEGGNFDARVAPTAFPRLSILPAGRLDADGISRLSPVSVRRVLAAARERFDIVVIDTGPILGSLEASLVAAAADGVVLTMGRGQQRAQAARAIEQLAALKARLLGVVFNRAGADDFRRAVSSASVRSVAPDTGMIVRRAGDGSERAEGRLGPMARTVASYLKR